MKTTVEISDQLLALAKSYAAESGCPLSAVIEEGLRMVLGAPASGIQYRTSDVSQGAPTGADPLDSYSWPELRAMIYGDPES